MWTQMTLEWCLDGANRHKSMEVVAGFNGFLSNGGGLFY